MAVSKDMAGRSEKGMQQERQTEAREGDEAEDAYRRVERKAVLLARV